MLQFANAGSVATLPQQEKRNLADVLRDGFIPRGDEPSTISSHLPVASRRVRHRRRMFEPQLRRLRLRHKTSALASSVPAGGKQSNFFCR
jgi:hypothetical protein